MSCDECSKNVSNNKISIFFQNNKNVKTEICKSCETWCQPGNMYCILCANRLGLCQKCGKRIFDNTYYKYSDIQWKDYLRKRRAKRISTDINNRLIKKMKLDQLRPKQEKKKKKSPLKIKVTNFSFEKNEGIELKEEDANDENNEDVKEDKDVKNKNKKKKKSNDEEIKFFDEEE
jgi:hypothetical protein